MLRYLTRRLAYYVILAFIATSLTYLMASLSFNPRAAYEARNPAPPASVINSQLSLIGVNDQDPLLERYASWVGKTVTGDLGRSITNGSINDEFGQRFAVSLQLLIIGSIVGLVLGVLLGFWNAVRQYQLSDRVTTILSFILLSTPVFLSAVLLKIGATGLNGALGFQLINFTGAATAGFQGSFWPWLSDRAVHLLLPTISIALGSIAIYSRYQRATMLDVLNSDYIRTARAKGLTRTHATLKHGLRTALIPMTTLFAYGFLGVFVGATFTEKIFGWNGLGAWFIDGVQANDVNVVVAYTLFASIVVLLAGFLADVANAALDPRVRAQR